MSDELISVLPAEDRAAVERWSERAALDSKECLKEPRACRECGTPTVFEVLYVDVCDECYSASSAVCQTCQEDDRDTIPF